MKTEKLVKMLGICTFYLLTTSILRENCKFFVKIEFLDKNLTFRIVRSDNLDFEYCKTADHLEKFRNLSFHITSDEWQAKLKGKGTVFENHRKSLIQHCERSELRLHFELLKISKIVHFGEFLKT